MKKSFKLELTWPGKEDWEKPEPRLLLEKNAYGSKKGAEENLLIHGDNLLGLKALERDYTGKVKCVYIDPPYNTKSCFTHYDDSMEHSLWLNMMKERLVILRRLLREDGSIWISIDDKECHYLKILCDEVFGRKNFVSCIAIKMSTASGVKTTHKEKTIIKEKEYIICFAKDKSRLTINPQYIPKPDWDDEFRYYIENRDSDPENWQISNLADVLKLKNIPFDPNDERFINFTIKNSDKIWRRAFVRSEFKEKSQNNKNRVLVDRKRNNFYYNGRQLYFLKNKFHTCLTENGLENLPSHLLGDFWDDINTSKLFNEGGVDFRNGKKPEFLISRVINLSTNPGDLVLDCFAGSGTTGAVAHKMRRRWIMIEMNDHCLTHILPRLQRVINDTDKGGITQAIGWKGGGGFQYSELYPSLLEKNKFNRWTISTKYNPVDLIKAMCLHAGYDFNPKREPWWMHGQSTENDFIFVTASTLTHTRLTNMSAELGENQSLLVYCGAFKANPNEFENLTIKKIPKSILNKCEWGRDDYSLKIALQKEVKRANKRRSKNAQMKSGDIIRMPMAAQGARS